MMSQQKEKPDISKLDPQVPWWAGLVVLGLLIFFFRLLNRYSVKNREKILAKEQLILASENIYDPFTKNENP
jgi:hypothetical protein